MMLMLPLSGASLAQPAVKGKAADLPAAVTAHRALEPLPLRLEEKNDSVKAVLVPGQTMPRMTSPGWVVIHERNGEVLSRAIQNPDNIVEALARLIYQRLDGRYFIFVQAGVDASGYQRLSDVMEVTKRGGRIRVKKS